MSCTKKLSLMLEFSCDAIRQALRSILDDCIEIILKDKHDNNIFLFYLPSFRIKFIDEPFVVVNGEEDMIISVYFSHAFFPESIQSGVN